ncbi:hypothetical protein BU17DRAFT_48860 [Hysterangium stoloniferum]|nr:hypothetical protein BU17DRAFT_48860 [Hysterangium stoloniferum]
MEVHTNSPIHRRDLPVKCDDNGNIRILVVGNSGTGKHELAFLTTTMADRLGGLLKFPVVHLDEVHWLPNWVETPRDEFRGQIQEFTNTNDNWVIDGNYKSSVGDLTFSLATTIVWMDPPFILYFSRLILRTFFGLLGWTPPCSPGCDENLKSIFTLGEQSILWYAWTQHRPYKEFYTSRMRTDEACSEGKWVRLGGWGSDSRKWLTSIESLSKAS